MSGYEKDEIAFRFILETFIKHYYVTLQLRQKVVHGHQNASNNGLILFLKINKTKIFRACKNMLSVAFICAEYNDHEMHFKFFYCTNI